jgi:hypothetical protein
MELGRQASKALFVWRAIMTQGKGGDKKEKPLGVTLEFVAHLIIEQRRG